MDSVGGGRHDPSIDRPLLHGGKARHLERLADVEHVVARDLQFPGGRWQGRWNKSTSRHSGSMKAAKLLVSCLENERVRFAFGIPGEENLDLMDSLRESSIRFVLTRHEEAAAFMADVPGRLTTPAGVCIATLGPGAAQHVTGVADAFLDRATPGAISAPANLA